MSASIITGQYSNSFSLLIDLLLHYLCEIESSTTLGDSPVVTLLPGAGVPLGCECGSACCS